MNLLPISCRTGMVCCGFEKCSPFKHFNYRRVHGFNSSVICHTSSVILHHRWIKEDYKGKRHLYSMFKVPYLVWLR